MVKAHRGKVGLKSKINWSKTKPKIIYVEAGDGKRLRMRKDKDKKE